MLTFSVQFVMTSINKLITSGSWKLAIENSVNETIVFIVLIF